ncbi:unnamed protein product [Debaryomyces tyrocola]|nr:unnamed protein product [Debaryomyces tyrocola]
MRTQFRRGCVRFSPGYNPCQLFVHCCSF